MDFATNATVHINPTTYLEIYKEISQNALNLNILERLWMVSETQYS